MNIEVTKLRAHLHTKSFNYSTDLYPFKKTLENLFGCPLGILHKTLGNFDKFNRANDQSTLAHKVFYSNYESLIKPIYEEFIEKFISEIIYPHQFYYQVIPTFRIGLPGNVFVGEFHKDSNYNHLPYEINFNLGLANYIGEAALKTEILPNTKKWEILECPYGKIFSFDHIDCIHGSEINNAGETMVSFDFRLALKDMYYDSEAESVNLKTSFKPGFYFSSKLIN